MKAIELILLVSGITLIAFGFIHIFILDRIYFGKPSYLKMKWLVDKITLALTIIFFGSGLALLINLFLS